MGFPTNSTNLSLAGALKWLLVIASIPCWFKAWQGVVGRETATGYGRSGAASTRLLTGDEALAFGLWNVLYGVLLLAAAWAVWFFWQRNED